MDRFSEISQNYIQGWECSKGVKHLPTVHKALGLILAPFKKRAMTGLDYWASTMVEHVFSIHHALS